MGRKRSRGEDEKENVEVEGQEKMGTWRMEDRKERVGRKKSR